MRKRTLVFGISALFIVSVAVLVIVLLYSKFYIPNSSFAFTGPGTGAGTGSGAIGVDAFSNLSIGTSTPASNTKLFIVASSTGSSNYPIRIVQPDTSFLLFVRDDGIIGIKVSSATSTLTVAGEVKSTTGGFVFPDGTSQTTAAGSSQVPAQNVTAGVFGAGNFAFPSSLGISTSSQVGLPAALTVYATSSFLGNVGMGTAVPQTRLEVGVNSGTGVDEKITVRSQGRSGLELLSDTANSSGEPGGAYVLFSQDGVLVQTILGSTQVAGQDPAGSGYTNALSNYTLLGNRSNNGLQFGTNGSVRMTIDANGRVGIGTTSPGDRLDLGGGNIVNVNKLTVTTVDPLYTIGGTNYATYVSAIAGGVKEEYVGHGKLEYAGGEHSMHLDFDRMPHGSDLWLWRKAVDFSRDSVDVLLTPYGEEANLWYKIAGNSIVINGNKPVEFSMRLVGKRVDWRHWPTLAPDQSAQGIPVADAY